MGITIYFQAHINGSSQKIPVKSIVDIFLPFISKKNESGIEVRYDELNSSFINVNLEGKYCNNFSVSRPCGNQQFYKGLYKVCQLGNFISLYPDGDCVVFNKDTLDHLPESMKEAVTGGGFVLEIVPTEKQYLKRVFSS